MIETIITICALTMISPYYDCNSHINIEILSERSLNDNLSIGTAEYGHSIFDNNGTIQLVHDYKERTGLRDHLLKGKGVLWHEILHMKCKCDWHEHWDVLAKTKDKMHSHVNIPTIPQSVIPFLKERYQ